MSTLRALLLFASLTTLVGCGCSGTLVVHAFEKGNGDPAGLVEVRIEEANRTASDDGAAEKLREVEASAKTRLEELRQAEEAARERAAAALQAAQPLPTLPKRCARFSQLSVSPRWKR